MKRSRGLTIVELLVVLVVVAIAAALLYPVFGNAREASKRGLCMSNLRRIGRAFAGYVAANDNAYPLSMVRDSAGWRADSPSDFPAGWAVESHSALRDAGFWANAIRDALDRYDFLCPQSIAADTFESGDRRAVPGKEAWLLSYAYNGYLHSLPSSGIADYEACVMVWEGQGRAATVGQARSNPVLNCETAQPCIFSKDMGYGSKLVLPKFLLQPNTMWVHGRGTNFLMADLHVRWKRLGAMTGTKVTDKATDPFRTYDRAGNPTSPWLVDGVAPMFSPLAD